MSQESPQIHKGWYLFPKQREILQMPSTCVNWKEYRVDTAFSNVNQDVFKLQVYSSLPLQLIVLF